MEAEFETDYGNEKINAIWGLGGSGGLIKGLGGGCTASLFIILDPNRPIACHIPLTIRNNSAQTFADDYMIETMSELDFLPYLRFTF